MSLPLSLAQGTTVGGHYIIGPLMNSGGFGAVYQGIDTSEGNRPCAIKETYDVTPTARRQALMEASVLFTVRSPHLPEVYDAFESGGRFYLVMQLIEGQNLLELLRARVGAGQLGEQEPHRQSQGPCSEQEVLSWLLPIMDVLQELHSRHPAIIHRDIKPGNIILTPKQTAVLVDFGLTKLYDPNRNTQTMVKAVTAGFSPVEQYTGKTTPQSDIYSMAATIYLLLTNRLPPASMTRVTQDTLIAPRLLNPALSPKIERALLKALAVHASDRYQSMDQFAQALRAPAFQAHADPTIAIGPARASAKTPSVAPMPTPPPPIYAYSGATGGQPPLQTPISTPYYTQSPAYTPGSTGGYIMAPPSIGAPVRALPGSFGQGCLWGIVQGSLAALLVLFLKPVAYFYLAILMGFVFYVLAGFMTTRRGGPSLRGAWAGFWAGIDSTMTFWLVLFTGLVFRTVLLLQREAGFARGRGIAGTSAFARAWRAVLPDFLLHPFLSSQQFFTNLLLVLSGGLLVAFALGWIGGVLGRSRYKGAIASKKRP